MKRKPRWTLEMLTASLAVLCGLLLLALLVQRPGIWPFLAALVVLWGIGATLFRCKLRRWVVRWTSGTTFEKSKVQFSLEPLSQPAALLSGETVLWYNSQFRTRLLGGQDVLASRVQKLLPGLDLQLCRKREGQLLTLADGYWSVHSSTVPGNAESMTLLVLNEETELRRIEAEYKASRPGYLAFQMDGYDDVFGDLMDSERARLLEGVNRILEDMIGRGSGFLRRVGSGGRYIAVVEERQLEQFANRGYDVLDKIRALDPSVSLSLSIGIGRGARTLREAQDMAEKVTRALTGAGLWGVEFFLSHENGVYFSELSPRPHDTGMVTLAGTQNLNEFELHCRAVLGLPIPGIKQERIGASAVILSPIASQERPNYRGMEEVTKEEDTYLRIFGKPTTRVNRRMGVVLCYAPLDSDLDTLRDKAKRIADRVEVY